MDHLLQFFHSKHDIYLLDVDLQVFQDRLVVAPPSKFYTVYTVLFHKYGGENVAVTNGISKCSMFVPTKANVKLDNGKTGHSQGIGIILCRFTKLIYYISSGTSLLLSRSPFQHYLIRCPQILCWF